MDVQPIKRRFGIVGNSPALNRAINTAMRVAQTNLTVLITGESGVGKEVFSQIIHQLSTRKHNKFIAVNCGAIPEGTIDSELFGHEKGSFTGAHEKRKGYFETVDGGTIFLDEVGELPIGTQARLLRVLESGEFIKVGSSKAQRTDVRVVAATNVDLAGSIKKGKFREDLYYRLCTVPIEIPPLRERGEDIYLLFRKFAVDFAERNRISPIRLDDAAKELLLAFKWPGNVRQLKNVAEQVSVLSAERDVGKDELNSFIPANDTKRLPALFDSNVAGDGFSDRELLYKLLFDIKQDINDLKRFMLRFTGGSAELETPQMPARREYEPTSNYYREPEPSINEKTESRPILIENDSDFKAVETVEESLSLADKEKELIIKALHKHRGKRKNAADDLGISERTLYRKIKEYELQE